MYQAWDRWGTFLQRQGFCPGDGKIKKGLQQFHMLTCPSKSAIMYFCAALRRPRVVFFWPKKGKKPSRDKRQYDTKEHVKDLKHLYRKVQSCTKISPWS